LYKIYPKKKRKTANWSAKPDRENRLHKTKPRAIMLIEKQKYNRNMYPTPEEALKINLTRIADNKEDMEKMMA
jgi:hypothetical protein